MAESPRRQVLVGLFALSLFLCPGGSFAESLNPFSLNLSSIAPDIKSTGLTLTYDVQSTIGDVTTGRLTVEGLAKEMDVNDLAPPDDFWIVANTSTYVKGAAYSIDIMLEVNTAAETITTTDGTIEIKGYLRDARAGVPPAPPLVAGSGTLLTGDATNFGFTDAGIFEFEFTSTGGDLTDADYPVNLTPVFNGVGKRIAVILDPVKEPAGNPFSTFFVPRGLSAFTADFSNKASQGQSDTYSPEPSTLGALGSLLLAAAFACWRRR